MGQEPYRESLCKRRERKKERKSVKIQSAIRRAGRYRGDYADTFMLKKVK